MNRRPSSFRAFARRPRALRSWTLSLVLGALAASPAVAQKSDAQIADDIEFAMGLAESWGFVDLAGEVIQRIEDEGVPERTQERLGLAKCDVFATGAFNESYLPRRMELFDEALLAYQSFIANNSRSERLADAESGYVRVCSAYALTLEIAQEDAVGEEAEALRQRRVEVLTDAVAKTGELIEVLEGQSESAAGKRELINMMLTRGRMLLALGRSQEDGTFAFEQAFGVLENTVYVAGDGSPGALQAYELLGRLFLAQDDPQSAYAFFQAIVDVAIPPDQEAWELLVDEQELDQTAKDQRWLFVQLATEGLIESLLASGEIEEANRYALHYHNTLKREGFQIASGFGYEAYLAVARCLLDSGGWVGGNWNSGDAAWFPDEDAIKDAGVSKRNRYTVADRALAIAQQVNRENKGSRMQVRAQRLIGKIIERPGVQVDPNVLYEAAEGVYNEGEYEQSVYAFKRLLRVLDNEDAALRAEFMPKTLYRIGRAYVRLGRDLEAAMAFREACTTWQGDPEYDSPNARSFFTLMKTLNPSSGESPELQALYTEAENLAERFASQTDQDEIKWNKAEKLYRDKDYDQAIAKFAEISQASNYYERAMVRIAVCTYRKGDKAAGEELFRTYLEDYLGDPVASAIGDSEIKAAQRKVARASAEFYYALAAFDPTNDALGEFEDGKRTTPPPAEEWEEVVRRVGDYPTEFKDQTSTVPWMMYMYVTAKLQLSELAEARAMYDRMLEKFESSRFTATASIDIYKRLGDLQEQTDDAAERMKLEREMAGLLKAGNAASEADYNKLRGESRHWETLREWAEAERVLRKLQSTFGDGERAADVEKFVLPDLANALIQQQKVAEAHTILTALMAEDAANRPSRSTLMNYIRSVTGWVEGDAQPFTVVPGVGTSDEDFDRVTKLLRQLLNAESFKYSCSAFELRFQEAWAYYAWATAEGGPRNSDKVSTAKNMLLPLTTLAEIGEDFQGVEDRCRSEEEFADELGGGVLQKRFQWLWSMVRSAS